MQFRLLNSMDVGFYRRAKARHEIDKGLSFGWALLHLWVLSCCLLDSFVQTPRSRFCLWRPLVRNVAITPSIEARLDR